MISNAVFGDKIRDILILISRREEEIIKTDGRPGVLTTACLTSQRGRGGHSLKEGERLGVVNYYFRD